MKRIGHIIGLAALALLAACGRAAPGQPTQAGGNTVTFTLSSTAFADGQAIPAKYTCDGANASPPLRWEEASQARSFVLIVDDPDAPGATFTHWVLFNLPANINGLPEGVPKQGQLAHGGRQGKSDFGKVGYGGPCPPAGTAHRYVFTLYALDAEIDVPAGAPRDHVEAAMTGHVMAKSELVGRYAR